MASPATSKASERRAEHLLNDLLVHQGWDLRPPPQGDLLFQHEYRAHPTLNEALKSASKTGSGAGVPEALLVERASLDPLAVIETKPSASDVDTAISEAQTYADALIDAGYAPLAVGLAGVDDKAFELRVTKWDGSSWQVVTYDGHPIGWVTTKADVARVALRSGPTELRPTVPPPEVLARRADEINRLLRESNVFDQLRPAYIGAMMLALWQSKGAIRRNKSYILDDINHACRQAFVAAGKADLARSLYVDAANDKLADRARRIATILERLNVTVLTAEHDYLGQLYETFFRYTGGNTIGQYFTPRHVSKFMADICSVSRDDIVLDPACGSGGFLVACMDRVQREYHLSKQQSVDLVKDKLIGFENEPVTAALCVANMILRGDGSTGVRRDDCFTSTHYPEGTADVVLMNPPFPHKKTDTPAQSFVDRALDGLRKGGKLAVILPTSLLVKQEKGSWREKIIKNNTLLGVCQFPEELFQPFASTTTSMVLIEKGVPQDAQRETTFVRLHHDGYTLRKGVRVARPSEPDQMPDAIDAILNKKTVPGFSGTAVVSGKSEWAPGAYIPSAPPEEVEVKAGVDVLLRRLASFYTRYAPEIVQQRSAVEAGDVDVTPYRDIVSPQRLRNAKAIKSGPGTIGHYFDILYGMKELHSREGYGPGPSLIISPTEQYNGCYGWLEFPKLLEPPFVTVAQTGNIGEAFVHFEPCAVNDDCLVLLPKEGADISDAQMVLAAASIRTEKWRFTYGRKLTPSRIASFSLPDFPELERWIAHKLSQMDSVVAASLAPYELSQPGFSGTGDEGGQMADEIGNAESEPGEDSTADTVRHEDDQDLVDALEAKNEPGGTDWKKIKSDLSI